MDEKNPMDKNELGAPIPSRNQHTGSIPEIKTAAGAPVSDNQDTMTAGKRAPVSLQDTWFFPELVFLLTECYKVVYSPTEMHTDIV